MIKQYAASPRIQQLMTNMAAYLDPSQWTDEFYNIVWNVDSAQGFGLDIWGTIVGVDRYLNVGSSTYFGFNTTPTESWQPFNQGPFYGGPAATSTFKLADNAFRVLILAKALTNVTETTAPGVNAVLQSLFPGRGRCWVNDLGSMSMRFVFEFALESWERAVLVSGEALPRPAGVHATIAEIPTSTFGFAEAGASAQPFNQGTFLSTGAVNDVA
jgi:hypothetical protein